MTKCPVIAKKQVLLFCSKSKTMNCYKKIGFPLICNWCLMTWKVPFDIHMPWIRLLYCDLWMKTVFFTCDQIKNYCSEKSSAWKIQPLHCTLIQSIHKTYYKTINETQHESCANNSLSPPLSTISEKLLNLLLVLTLGYTLFQNHLQWSQEKCRLADLSYSTRL